MGSLYNTIEQLCINKGITITQMCKESGASRASLTDLKMGRKQSLSTGTLLKIANYFDTSIENLLGHNESRSSIVNPAKPELSGMYLRLAHTAQELGVAEEDIDFILAMWAKHKKENL